MSKNEKLRREKYGLTQSKREEMRGWLERAVTRQKGRCAYCDCALHRSKARGYLRFTPTLDHIWSLARGGPNVEENTVAACHRCNQLKGDLWLEDFVALLAETRLVPQALIDHSKTVVNGEIIRAQVDETWDRFKVEQEAMLDAGMAMYEGEDHVIVGSTQQL